MAKHGRGADRVPQSARAALRALPQQSCESCGALFVAARAGRKHCSGRCRAASSRRGKAPGIGLQIRGQLDRLFGVE
jgi:hypothetical protein